MFSGGGEAKCENNFPAEMRPEIDHLHGMMGALRVVGGLKGHSGARRHWVVSGAPGSRSFDGNKTRTTFRFVVVIAWRRSGRLAGPRLDPWGALCFTETVYEALHVTYAFK